MSLKLRASCFCPCVKRTCYIVSMTSMRCVAPKLYLKKIHTQLNVRSLFCMRATYIYFLILLWLQTHFVQTISARLITLHKLLDKHQAYRNGEKLNENWVKRFGGVQSNRRKKCDRFIFLHGKSLVTQYTCCVCVQMGRKGLTSFFNHNHSYKMIVTILCIMNPQPNDWWLPACVNSFI